MWIKSISFDQDEILRNIVRLHTGPIECDPTYGNGNFYRKLPPPRLRFDLQPRQAGTIRADVRNLPLPDNAVRTVVFDPPFLIKTGGRPEMKKRFGCFHGKVGDLLQFYREAMTEIHRVLVPRGWLVFKCQDIVQNGNHFVHCEIYNMAREVGFRPVDLFVLVARHRMVSPTNKRQVHARKYHAYFWVFRRTT